MNYLPKTGRGRYRMVKPLSTILQLYRVGQFYRMRKLEYLEKTTDLPQVTDNFITN
jgi:hypothetical protein